MKLQAVLKNKIVKNAGWLVGGTLLQKILSFAVGVLSARYLGPGNYGLINYAAAYIAFFSSICTLGINSVIIKDFVDHPDEQGTAIGTTLVLRAVSSILSGVMVVGVLVLVDGDEPLTILVGALSCLSLPLQIFDTLKQWFQSRLESKYCTIAMLIGYIVMSAYKIALLAYGKKVQWFALATALEYLAIAILLLAAYGRKGGPRFCFSMRKAKALLSSGRSYIVAGLMVSVYASTDKLMLKHMLGEEAVGYYTLAVSVSTMFAFVLSAVIDSMHPVIIQSYSENSEVFEKRNRQLYAMVFYGALFMSAGIAVCSSWIIRVLYGAEYISAVLPLRVVVWYTAFSYLGVARNAWMVCRRRQSYLKYLYAGAAIVNVLLNLLLIPQLGAVGAAIASLITQMITTVGLPLCIPALRENAKLMLEAICLRKVF